VNRTVSIRRALFGAAAVAFAWAAVIAWTGGFAVQLGAIRFSSRQPLQPILIAVAALLAALRLARVDGLGSALTQDREFFLSLAGWFERVYLRRAAVALAAVGIALDLYQWIGALPLWLDEEMIALNVRDRSFAHLGGPLWLEQSAPYGWLAIQRAALLLLGDSELAMRFVPLAFGVATVLAAVWIGRRWMRPTSALGFVLLCWIAQWLSHNRFEVKHYSADAFFGLWLPALAVWAIEADTARTRTRRALVWWATAAAAQWLSNGALLVAPGCAAVVVFGIWRRDGRRAAAVAAAAGVVWLVAFAGHYALMLRYTDHLRAYWSDRFPSPGVRGTLHSFASYLRPLANNPGGTRFWISLWVLAACGFAFGSAAMLGAAFATVPASAFVYAALGFVPLYDRFSLWIVPALYVGVLLLADRAGAAARVAWTRERWLGLALSIAILALIVRLGSNIVSRGTENLEIPHIRANHQLDDRAAVRWLMNQRRPSDVLVTTRLGWPALWWYGHMSIADESATGAPAISRHAAFQMMDPPTGAACQTQPVATAAGAGRRLLVYLGFPDVADGFEDLLRQTLTGVGVVTAYREFGDIGRAVVVDRDAPPERDVSAQWQPVKKPQLEGCIGIAPAQRW
jgi:hypothetical protein